MKILKCVITIIVILFIIAIGFIILYKPFGDILSFVNQNDYTQETKLFYDGTFHDITEIKVLNGNESEFSDDEETIPKGEIPVHQLKTIPVASIEQLKWIWFGHSSSMLQMQGLNILIDPVFSEYASPIQGFGAKRFSKLPIDIENMPNIDILAISHDHYDHLDYQTIIDIDSKVKNYCVPLGVEKHLIRWGIDENKIHSFAWWEEIEIDGLKITSIPGRHYTGRLSWQTNTTLWNGYVFENNDYKTYYTGDTGYSDYFKEVYEKFGEMDLVILENGQYDKSWESIHMLPEQGIQAVKDLHAKWVVPVHFGTFSLGRHSWDHPIKEITRLAEKENINLATPMIGEIVDYHDISNFKSKWWENGQ